jgi:mannosyltransferase
VATSTAPTAAAARRPTATSGAAALIGLIALGAVLRFWRVGHQSFWLDEAYTVALVKRSFGHMLSTIPHSESTPPLYYSLAWVWSRVFGYGTAGLRSLSALIGVATIPVAYLAVRRLFNPRAAIATAALVAVNPYFVWYSQEARSYALLVFFAALSLLAFAHVLRARTRRACLLWGGVAVLALLTHYFAAFLLVPEAAYLLYVTRARWMAAAIALPVVTACALVPLALAQRRTAHAQWIGNISLGRRVVDVPKKFVTGELGLPLPVLGVVAGAVVTGAIVWALTRTDADTRRTTAVMVGLALAVVAIPLVLAAAGADYVIGRNLIVLYLPLAFATAAGLAAAGRPGAAGLAVVCLVALTVNAYVAYDAKVQRDDWRGLAKLLGPVTHPRTIVIGPGIQKPAFALYAGYVRHVGPLGETVSEIDAILDTRPPRATPRRPPAGFKLASVRRTASWELVRYTAPAPMPLSPQQFQSVQLGSEPAGLYVQGGPPG